MILIYSDPHLGLVLGANTTVNSRQALQRRLHAHLMDILQGKFGFTGSLTVCAGDFFHKHQNSEDIIMDSMAPASLTNVILGGNHDVTNIGNRRGSLDLMSRLLPNNVFVRTKFGKVVVQSFDHGNTRLVMVPHHSTQALFDEALVDCRQMASGGRRKNILILHCNYAMDFASNDVSLNLSVRQAEDLLKTFDGIVIGHDHHPKEDFDGKLVVLGNTHPTNFGDISDKRVMLLDERTGTWEFMQVWSKQEGYAEIGPDDLDDLPASVNFLRLVGEVEPAALHDFTKKLRSVWSSRPELYAVRSEVTVATGTATARESIPKSIDVHALITDELQDSPDLLALWQEIAA